MTIEYNNKHSGLKTTDYEVYNKKISELQEEISKGDVKGDDFLGWRLWPIEMDETELKDIAEHGKFLYENKRRIYSLGIGGSYLGAEATISALGDRHKVIFSGNTLSSIELSRALEGYNPKEDHIVVISKSGTTMETSIAFRLFRNKGERILGDKANQEITAITDGSKGALYEFALKKGYKRYVLPDSIGGRYSVLTAVGLLPIAASGIDILELMSGARDEAERLNHLTGLDNPACQYALDRHLLYNEGKMIELLIAYEPRLEKLGNWYEQLFGESEGKEGKGIFPTSLIYSRDLHSMGQWVQEGPRNIFETLIHIEDTQCPLLLPELEADDGLSNCEGLDIQKINDIAMLATRDAHVEGGVPNLQITMKYLDPYYLGALFYFLEYACMISAYLLNINPFNQPGVEAYKKNIQGRLNNI